MDLTYYRGKRVLVTGHTGFKGTWLTKILIGAGAEVLGYSRCTEREPSLFMLSSNDFTSAPLLYFAPGKNFVEMNISSLPLISPPKKVSQLPMP